VRWLENPSPRNVDNLKSVRRAASRHFRNKKEENLKAKIDELETSIRIENIRDLCRESVNLRRVTSLELI
jgi:hypothetical protein